MTDQTVLYLTPGPSTSADPVIDDPPRKMTAAFRASESLTLIERMCEEWKTTGVKAVTQVPTAENA